MALIACGRRTLCSFPLLTYIIRFQVFTTLLGAEYPSVAHVIGLNVLLTTVCVLMAIFYPNIGNILRFTGAFCGLAYVFALPALCHMARLRQSGQLTWPSLIFHGGLIAVGVGNLVGQFAVTFA